MAVYKNRLEAGQQLASRLSHLQNDNPVVLAIPRGGVPVAAPVARELKTSFNLVPIRRLAISWRPECDYGYVDSQGETHLNHALVGQVRLTSPEIHRIAQKERAQLVQDLENWGVPLLLELPKRTVLLITDGMHSGWAMYSAIEVVRKLGAGKVVAALPVSHFRAKRFVERHCDEVISLLVEDIALFRLEDFYKEFPPVTDEEIKGLLTASGPRAEQPAA